MDIISPPPHNQALQSLNDAISRMNLAILQAVDAGVSVELIRTSRYHDGQGNYGDQVNLAIREGSED